MSVCNLWAEKGKSSGQNVYVLHISLPDILANTYLLKSVTFKQPFVSEHTTLSVFHSNK